MAAPDQALPLSRGCPSSTSLSPPRGDRTLLVRHLPAELSAEEKEDLLRYFGAQSVRVLSDKGRLVRARACGVSGGPGGAGRPGGGAETGRGEGAPACGERPARPCVLSDKLAGGVGRCRPERREKGRAGEWQELAGIPVLDPSAKHTWIWEYFSEILCTRADA